MPENLDTIDEHAPLVMSSENPAFLDAEHKKRIESLENMTKEVSAKLNSLHDREFHRMVTQSALLLFISLVILLLYFLFPMGLLAVTLVTFILSWVYPLMVIPMWASIILVVITAAHIMAGNITWTVSPVWK